jgi:integrase
VSVSERRWTLQNPDGTPKRDGKGRPIVRVAWVVHFRWTHADGRVERIRQVSPVQTRKGAEEWERQKRLTLMGGPLAPRARLMLVKEAAETLLRTSAPDIKASTLGRYRDAFRVHILPALGNKAISQVRDEDVDELKASLCATLKPGTVNGILRVLRRLLKWSEDRKLLAKAPKVRKVKDPAELVTKYLPVEEIEELLTAALQSEPEWYPLFLLLARTGLRISEAAGLQWGDIDFNVGQLVVRRGVYQGRVETPKAGRVRELPLRGEVVKALKELRGPSRRADEWIFPGPDGGPLSRHQVRLPLHRACDVAKVQRISVHQLRHSVGSDLASKGVSLYVIGKVLGHASPAMSQRYSAVQPSALKDAIRLLGK